MQIFEYLYNIFDLSYIIVLINIFISTKGDQMNKEFYVGWGTLALINAGLAQGKNRSGFNWFLLSIFLGPLATFFLVISDKK